jgi:hypothetical protein
MVIARKRIFMSKYWALAGAGSRQGGSVRAVRQHTHTVPFARVIWHPLWAGQQEMYVCRDQMAASVRGGDGL